MGLLALSLAVSFFCSGAGTLFPEPVDWSGPCTWSSRCQQQRSVESCEKKRSSSKSPGVRASSWSGCVTCAALSCAAGGNILLILLHDLSETVQVPCQQHCCGARASSAPSSCFMPIVEIALRNARSHTNSSCKVWRFNLGCLLSKHGVIKCCCWQTCFFSSPISRFSCLMALPPSCDKPSHSSSWFEPGTDSNALLKA